MRRTNPGWVFVFSFALAGMLAPRAASLVAQDSIKVTRVDAELELVAEGYKFTEGPAVDSEGNVFFTDQPNDRILKWSVDGKLETWLQPAGRSNGLFFDRAGSLIACADEKSQLWKIAPDKSFEVLLTDFGGKRFNGPNDVWIAADGSYYFTDPFYRRNYWAADRQKPDMPKRVYRYDAKTGALRIVAEKFVQPNGIVGDAEAGILYVADIGNRKTYRFTIAEDGSLKNRSLFVGMGSDGMTLDQDGNLYLTGKGVTVFNAAGEKIQTIEVPEGWTANVCFGGRQRDYLFITASDSLYRIPMKTRGL